jgi:hypothetical protein
MSNATTALGVDRRLEPQPVATPSRHLLDVWYVRDKDRTLATIRRIPTRGEYRVDARGHPIVVVRSFTDALAFVCQRQRQRQRRSCR